MKQAKSQKEAVENHLKGFGHLTSMDAIKEYGISRLSHYIYLLRKEGWRIETMPRKITNRFGHATVFAVYNLIEAK